MYSVVLLAAMAVGADTPGAGEGGCACGSYGGSYGGWGYYGGGFGAGYAGYIIGAGYACHPGVAGGHGGYFGYYPYGGSPYHLIPVAPAAKSDLPPAKEVPQPEPI